MCGNMCECANITLVTFMVSSLPPKHNYSSLNINDHVFFLSHNFSLKSKQYISTIDS